ncbi:hypothetical protein C0Z18_31050 [Trinickia dabaoshanensis]|uniref:Peptidase M56 domain-containing protein n=1 Tax=Trinickia dabaoshanensis TaxID=564714 RepID=A0A2N7VBQ1_9BURK|nr:hypothetical protein [Trinickia dabaoshanensis]PMS14569.1 hypothetical protein C0Z18_31050 [Trinickia dabaoshanensis]
MERESLLTLLMLLLGGIALQPLAMFAPHSNPDAAERQAWIRLWLPLAPALVTVAWLCGWALREPDPVADRVDQWVLIGACLPFAAVLVRAAARAAWALARDPSQAGVFTAGLLRPRVTFSPFLARTLDDAALEAAWQHEQAHARHRDPLRIWLAQLATDLQWPWPGAGVRFAAWLEALEYARDDEARRHGASGEALAAALLATLRHTNALYAAHAESGGQAMRAQARLVGSRRALQKRIARLLAPMPAAQTSRASTRTWLGAHFALLLLVAGVLGAVYGDPIVRELLAWIA